MNEKVQEVINKLAEYISKEIDSGEASRIDALPPLIEALAVINRES